MEMSTMGRWRWAIGRVRESITIVMEICMRESSNRTGEKAKG